MATVELKSTKLTEPVTPVPTGKPTMRALAALFGTEEFLDRHIGIPAWHETLMLEVINAKSRQQLIEETVPGTILRESLLSLPAATSEAAALAELKVIAQKNKVWRSVIGAGYANTITPEPIKRNVLENPGWYTAYTPYQAEVAQGRLESLMNYQQMVIDLTGLDVANASLLDEATAAAEAMGVIRRAVKSSSQQFFVDSETHPQVLAVIKTRAKWMGISVVTGSIEDPLPADCFGAYLQNPGTTGVVRDLTTAIETLHQSGAKVAVGSDLLALVLMKSPGEMGADISVGNSQRFGVPLGFGGPHAAFFSARQELVRLLPGRIIGVSRDAAGRPAYRMSLQTREQHIRRDKATSNICTAQALLANMAALYAVYHGPEGLKRIASRVSRLTALLASTLSRNGLMVNSSVFDTLYVRTLDTAAVVARANQKQINLRRFGDHQWGITLDETTRLVDVADLCEVLTGQKESLESLERQLATNQPALPEALRRTEPILTHPVFRRFHTETEFVRYVKRLENKDISLVHSMIPLGSCTMKLNAASEMAPVSWPEFASLHPFVPTEQAAGYMEMLAQLERWLAEVTGFAKVSFQPNSGAQGEYAGLMAIRRYQAAMGQGDRNVCLIPVSAHGTNPASAQMMGLNIVPVACDGQGNIDLADLKAKVASHRSQLSALMVTYPSTHGVFEEAIKEVCQAVHDAGGQVYMDGANLNAQAGLTQPGDIGADVCHLNLHKTFCIPHGGGGPGMGPIAVAAHLAPHLASDPFTAADEANSVSSAPYGSALIATISWMYIRMMGASGIRRATEVAILNANYIAKRLAPRYPILYTGSKGRVAHECILDTRSLKEELGITAEDIAKRLMDYGFHAPTLSFPVPDTLMIEPTESESKAELDRFCDAMLSIADEIAQVRSGTSDRIDNPLKNAPHTASEIAGEWTHPYSREVAVFPLPYVREAKFWPSVKRIDNVAGDRQLICTCPPMEDYVGG
jgi:glycine dehydrogenase